MGVWDVWVRPPRRAASQPGSRDRWGGAAAQWPQFERSPIQIGGGGDTGEENSGGGGSRLSSILKETGQQPELAKKEHAANKQVCKYLRRVDERMKATHPGEMKSGVHKYKILYIHGPVSNVLSLNQELGSGLL